MKKRILTLLLLGVTVLSNAQYAKWKLNGTTAYYDTGSVAIGRNTAYVATRLHIKAGTATPWGFMSEASANSRVTAVGHDGTAGYVSVSYSDANGTYSPLYLRTSNLVRLGISTDGNVGIGTQSPEYLLHVYNTNNPNNPTLAIGKLNANTSSKSSLLFFAGNGTFSNGFKIEYNKTADTDKLGFFGGTDVEIFTLKRDGNVGIGITNPDHKLTVNGAVRCEEVKVEIIPETGPDYVFEKDYDLLSLEALEAYINENKHLPEVPSAKEMETNGLNLKEMNLLLLKKVEELTLHLIDQNQEIKKVSEENRELKERVQKIESKQRK